MPNRSCVPDRFPQTFFERNLKARIVPPRGKPTGVSFIDKLARTAKTIAKPLAKPEYPAKIED
ncbi:MULTISPECIES: hypothetical protein [Bartonella]|uniref:hypothetical protein n=1 Tax=Bartonella TaxID=773 RepID=UPI0018DE5D7E|nr:MULTISPECIES: hypothetical protein [Bartonella]MBH9974232.1 hypothetical protein [Bartonella choladocola]MBI0013839.1 hypothetical protein [Bartonella sp. B10834G3]